jgi:hypothetical protein
LAGVLDSPVNEGICKVAPQKMSLKWMTIDIYQVIDIVTLSSIVLRTRRMLKMLFGFRQNRSDHDSTSVAGLLNDSSYSK